jgi:hypothetical protein
VLEAEYHRTALAAKRDLHQLVNSEPVTNIKTETTISTIPPTIITAGTNPDSLHLADHLPDVYHSYQLAKRFIRRCGQVALEREGLRRNASGASIKFLPTSPTPRSRIEGCLMMTPFTSIALSDRPVFYAARRAA